MPSTKPRRNVYIDSELLAKAEGKMRELGISFSALTCLAISQFIKLDTHMQITFLNNGRRKDD